jgi:hypothetical protein
MSLINSKDDIRRFVQGGNAVFTIENRLTGNRFTYKVTQKKNGDIYWVSLLNGPDNTSDYRFFGTIFPPSGVERFTHPPSFKHSTKGQITESAPSARAWKWFFERLFHPTQEFPIEFEFHHAGRCARCARQLTVPDSIRTGFGPECAEKMGF